MRNSVKSLVLAILSSFAAVVVGQMEGLVLGGNYGSSIHNIPDLRSSRPEDLPDVSEVQKDTTNGHSHKTLSNYLQAYSDNYKEIMKNAEQQRLALVKVEVDKECASRGALGSQGACALDPKSQLFCYWLCPTLRANDQHIASYAYAMLDLLETFCKPLQTAYESLFLWNKGRIHFRSYNQFKTTLGITDKTITTVLSQFSNALLGSIVRHVETPYAPFKETISRIQQYLSEGYPNATFNFQNNPNCMLVKPFQAVEVFGQALKADLSQESVLLPGFFFLSSVSKYISAKGSAKLTAIMELNRLVTGSAAGFGCSESTKRLTLLQPPTERDEKNGGGSSVGTCDELGKAPSLGFPIPPVATDGKSYSTIFTPVCSSKASSISDSGPQSDSSVSNDAESPSKSTSRSKSAKKPKNKRTKP